MKINSLEIRLYGEKNSKPKYISEAIEIQDTYYYRVDKIIIEITKKDYSRVIINPYLYYFSTALKLHLTIKRINTSARKKGIILSNMR